MYCFLRPPAVLVSHIWLGINIFKIHIEGEFKEKICKRFNNYDWECLVLAGTALPFVWGFFLLFIIYLELVLLKSIITVFQGLAIISGHKYSEISVTSITYLF